MSFKPPKVFAVHVKFTATETRYVAAESKTEARAIAMGKAEGEYLGTSEVEPWTGSARVMRADLLFDVPTWIKTENVDLFYEPERD